MLRSAMFTKRFWLQVPCTTQDCPSHRLASQSPGLSNTVWFCSDCATTATHTDLTAVDPFGDVFATQNGVLHRGIDPATTYTHATPDHHHSRDAAVRRNKTFHAPALHAYLSGTCAWDQKSILRILNQANLLGTAEYVPGHGLRTVITRNTP